MFDWFILKIHTKSIYKKYAKFGITKTLSDDAFLQRVRNMDCSEKEKKQRIVEECYTNTFLYIKSGKKRLLKKRKTMALLEPRIVKRTIDILMK